MDLKHFAVLLELAELKNLVSQGWSKKKKKKNFGYPCCKR